MAHYQKIKTFFYNHLFRCKNEINASFLHVETECNDLVYMLRELNDKKPIHYVAANGSAHPIRSKVKNDR